MKVTLLYTRDTEADRDIEELKRQMEAARIPLAEVDADSRDGAAITELYDLPGRPAVLITDDQGRLAQSWQVTLPSLDQIRANYVAVP